MSSMMSSNKNRSILSVDNPMDDDGFYAHRKFKAHRRTGAPTGKRTWHRTVRAKEAEATRKEIRDNT